MAVTGYNVGVGSLLITGIIGTYDDRGIGEVSAFDEATGDSFVLAKRGDVGLFFALYAGFRDMAKEAEAAAESAY